MCALISVGTLYVVSLCITVGLYIVSLSIRLFLITVFVTNKRMYKTNCPNSAVASIRSVSPGTAINYLFLLRHEGSTGKHEHANVQNIQKKKHVKPYAIKVQ